MDNVSAETRSRIMAAVGQFNTAPEMTVRRAVHRLGFRYRLHVKSLPGRPDLVFPGRRKVIFVHGCFWHRHRCNLATTPSTRVDFWQQKFQANLARDRRNIRSLRRLGWQVLVVWQCQTQCPDRLVDRLVEFLRNAE